MFSITVYPAKYMNKVDRYNQWFTETGYVVENIDMFRQVVEYDNIVSKCINGQRSTKNFLCTDCLLMDIDNHNNDPNFPKLWEDIKSRISGIAYYWVNSKSNNGYHLYFPLGDEYTDQKILQDLWSDLYKKISDVFDYTGNPIADKATKDRARQFFATTPIDFGYHNGRCWYSPPHEDSSIFIYSNEFQDEGGWGDLKHNGEDLDGYGLNDGFCETVLGNRSNGEIYTSIPNYAIVMANLGYSSIDASKIFCGIYNIISDTQYKKSCINYIESIIDGSPSFNIKQIYIKEQYSNVIDVLGIPRDRVILYSKSGNTDKQKLQRICENMGIKDTPILDSIKLKPVYKKEINYEPRGVNLIGQ